MSSLLESVEPVWVIHCSRCSNEDLSYGVGLQEAVKHFVAAGWTREQGRTFCPACNWEVSS